MPSLFIFLVWSFFNTIPPVILIMLYRPFSQQRGRRRRDTYIRVMVALVLLGIVCGFMVYEWNGYWSEDHYQMLNMTNENSEEKEHDHHHNHHEDETDNDDNDHDHKDGDDHHNHHSHTHEHSESLYHHAAIITDSGKLLLVIQLL